MASISKIEYSGDVYDIADQTARNSIGDLTTLSTTVKTNLVDAVNEVAEGGGGGALEVFDLSSDFEVFSKDNVLTVEPTFKIRSDGLIFADFQLYECTANFAATGFHNILSFSARVPLAAVTAIPKLADLLNNMSSNSTRFHASDFSTALCSPGAEGLVAFDFSGTLQKPSSGYAYPVQCGLSTFIAQVWSSGTGSGVGGQVRLPVMWM